MDGKKKNPVSEGPCEADACQSASCPPDMKVDFLFNPERGVWLLHDKPLPILKWVEYDAETETLTLVTNRGRIADLGLKIPADRSFYLERAMEVTALLMKDGFVTDFAIVPMVTSRMTVN